MSKDASPEPAAVVQQELGTLEVADQVFCDLVRRVVGETEGVAATRRVSSGFFRRSSAAEKVQLERGEGEVAVSLTLSARYEVRIPEAVEGLRRRVRSAIEEMTGYSVRAINVTIDHILPPDSEVQAEPEAPSEESAEPQDARAAGAPPLPAQE